MLNEPASPPRSAPLSAAVTEQRLRPSPSVSRQVTLRPGGAEAFLFATLATFCKRPPASYVCGADESKFLGAGARIEKQLDGQISEATVLRSRS
jgi:hypothetical protein